MNKCYSIAPLTYQGKQHFLVAAEKQDPCYLFDPEGNLEDKVWDGPGGVMSMVQVPGSDGQYLSTYKFYSPMILKRPGLLLSRQRKKGTGKSVHLSACRMYTDLTFWSGMGMCT